MHKIAILLVKVEEIHQKIIDGFSEKLLSYQNSSICEIEIFEAHSTAPSLIEREILRIIENEFDLIVTLGTRCAIATNNEMARRRHKIPIIFTGVSYPVECGLARSLVDKAPYLTGIAPLPPSDLIPLQLALRLHPKSYHFVIPYRQDSWDGRIEHEVAKMKRYLRKSGRKVSLVPIKPEGNFEADLLKAITKGAIVAPPTAATSSLDAPIIENVCRKFGAASLGFIDGVLPKTALFAYLDDANYMGFRTAEYAGKILLEKISPKNLPILEIKSTRYRKIQFNKKEMVKHGIAPLEEDVLATLHNNADRAHLPFYYYTVLDRWSALHGLRLYQGIKQAGHACDKDATYQFRHIQGDPYDQEYINQQLEEAQQPFFNGIVTFHQDELFDLQRRMIATNTFAPIVHVGVGSDNTQEPACNNPDWPARSPIQRLHLTELNPTYPIQLLDLLQLFRQQTTTQANPLKTFGLIYSADPKNMPPRLRNLITLTNNYLAKDGRILLHDGSWNKNEAVAKSHNMMRNVDASFVIEGFIHPQVALKIGRYAAKKRHMVCGAGMSIADAFVATYGMKEEVVGQHAFNALHTMTHQDSPSSGSQYLSSKDTYGAALDVQLCQKLGINLPEGLCAAIEHGISLEKTMHQYVSKKQLLTPEVINEKEY